MTMPLFCPVLLVLPKLSQDLVLVVNFNAMMKIHIVPCLGSKFIIQIFYGLVSGGVNQPQQSNFVVQGSLLKVEPKILLF